MQSIVSKHLRMLPICGCIPEMHKLVNMELDEFVLKGQPIFVDILNEL